MTTATIQIGNSDNKLTQQEWSGYWAAMELEITHIATERHFSAGSPCECPWQNYCWVVLIEETNIPALHNRLRVVRERFRQDSVAVTVGETQFV